MASGDTNITICNQALNLLGADTISSFSDTSNDAAAVCNNHPSAKKVPFSGHSVKFRGAVDKRPHQHDAKSELNMEQSTRS